jgi:hypothetical protein
LIAREAFSLELFVFFFRPQILFQIHRNENIESSANYICAGPLKMGGTKIGKLAIPWLAKIEPSSHNVHACGIM